MNGIRTGVKAVGLVVGGWALIGSLFLGYIMIFGPEAWQIFGTLMLPIIIVLALNLFACLSWIYGIANYKFGFMLASLLYWIIPLIYSVRFVWYPIKRNSMGHGENMHYFNTEEDDLTLRFEMTMSKPYFLTIFSGLFVAFYFLALTSYLILLAIRPKSSIDEDPRFNVQNVHLTPSAMQKSLQKSGQDLSVY